jgi:hypothetical protein
MRRDCYGNLVRLVEAIGQFETPDLDSGSPADRDRAVSVAGQNLELRLADAREYIAAMKRQINQKTVLPTV